MQIDIEKLASGYGVRAIADGRYTLSKGDYILSLDDLKRYTALALEEAAKAAEFQATRWQPNLRDVYVAHECAKAIRTLSCQITEGK